MGPLRPTLPTTRYWKQETGRPPAKGPPGSQQSCESQNGSGHNYSALGHGVSNVTFLPVILMVKLLSWLIKAWTRRSSWRQLEAPRGGSQGGLAANEGS